MKHVLEHFAAGVERDWPDASQQRLASELEDWPRFVDRLSLTGLTLQLAQHCRFVERAGDRVCLALDAIHAALRMPAAEDRLRLAIGAALGHAVRLEIRVPR